MYQSLSPMPEKSTSYEVLFSYPSRRLGISSRCSRVYHQGRFAALVSHHAPACIFLRLDDIQCFALMIYTPSRVIWCEVLAILPISCYTNHRKAVSICEKKQNKNIMLLIPNCFLSSLFLPFFWFYLYVLQSNERLDFQ